MTEKSRHAISSSSIDHVYNILTDSIEILMYSKVGIPDNGKAPFLKLSGTKGIVFPSFFRKMLSTIYFYNESGFRVEEIYYVMADYFLMNEVESHLFIMKEEIMPEIVFFSRHIFPEFSSPPLHLLTDRQVHAFHQFPVIIRIPQPLPVNKRLQNSHLLRTFSFSISKEIYNYRPVLYALQISGLKTYHFHANCLKTSASRLPPRGSWPEGPERAGDELPAARGRQFLQRPLTAVAVFPKGELSCLWIESFVPRSFRQLVPHVPQNVHG